MACSSFPSASLSPISAGPALRDSQSDKHSDKKKHRSSHPDSEPRRPELSSSSANRETKKQKQKMSRESDAHPVDSSQSRCSDLPPLPKRPSSSSDGVVVTSHQTHSRLHSRSSGTRPTLKDLGLESYFRGDPVLLELQQEVVGSGIEHQVRSVKPPRNHHRDGADNASSTSASVGGAAAAEKLKGRIQRRGDASVESCRPLAETVSDPRHSSKK